ncbi:hypothetical protein FHS18_003181 [Paenibacillus phyllosphaerae]|uniref:Chemotaxis protein CheX n=1 Tax=Paenibacillus phyllosphaerae TaxID=274593 RepID=A0A7W5AYK4_9BACL|nr:hypothetical protein [Paenibacillus phyllosphaerae]MBB3111113.1 hypothetical protein [Paenibacillus phyllosphaerae]
MFTQYFGHYLLNRNIVSLIQLQEAMEQLENTRVKLGVLSVNAGYMSAARAEEVHQLQARMDKRFGEIAVERGYMTEEQLEQLLGMQKEGHLVLGQALIDQGAITLDQFTAALEQYKADHLLSDDQFEAIKNGNIEELIAAVLKLDASIDQPWFREYLSLFAKNMIRFIDPMLYLEVNAVPQGYQSEWLVSQNIEGTVTLFTALSMNEGAFLRTASAYAQEEIQAPGELAEASVGEFLNLHNGLFLVSMSNQGIELGLKPQQIEHRAALPALATSYLITVYMSEGSFELIVAPRG